MAEGLTDSAMLKPSEDPAKGSSFRRRIEFLPARNPASSFQVSGGGDFYLETLNPVVVPLRQPAPITGSAEGNRPDSGGFHGLDQELSWKITVRRIGAGLENLGNTCFLNSVLQCLTYTEPFAAYLQSGRHKSSCHTSGFCAMCALQNHVRTALQSSGKILTPLNLVRNLRCISRNFCNSRQEDAHEYMVNLFESMHKCCLPSGISSDSPGANEKSLVHKIFGGRLRSQVKCTQCSYASNKFDPFLDLSLEISNADSLHKALADFTSVEYLDGGAKQYQCPHCKEKVTAQKHLTVFKSPNVLSIHFKRFGSDVPGEKIDKMVNFGPTLDLKTFLSNPQEDLNYTLYGVLVHAGWSIHSGHYYCFVRTSSGIWHSLDDNQVSQVGERTVLSQKAYMLFYIRNRNSSTKCSANVACKENSSSNVPGHRMAPSSASVLCEAIRNKMAEENLGVPQERSAVPAAECEAIRNKMAEENLGVLQERSAVPASEFPANGSASASNSSVMISREVICSTLQKANGHVAGEAASQQPNGCPIVKYISVLPNKQVDKDTTVSKPTVLNIVASPVANHQGISSKTDDKISALDDIHCVPATSPPINSTEHITENSSNGHLAENGLNKNGHVPSNETKICLELSGTTTIFRSVSVADGCSLASAASLDGCSLASAASLDRCSLASAASVDGFSLASAANIDGCSLASAASIDGCSLSFVANITPTQKDVNSLSNVQQSDMQDKQGRENLLQFDEAAVTLGLEESIAKEALKVAEKDPPTPECHGVQLKTKSSRKLVPVMPVYFGCKHLFRSSLHALKCKRHEKGKKRRRLRRKTPMADEAKDSIQVDGGASVSEAPVVVGQDCCHSSKKRSRSNGNDGNDEHATHLSGSITSMNTGVIETEVSSKCGIADPPSKHLKGSAGTELSRHCPHGARESSTDVKAQNLCSFKNLLTRGLAEPTVAKWEDEDVPSFRTNVVQDESNGVIGHVLNEWDEEYDRGRRKKLKKAKHGFGGPNPFQEIADTNSRQNMKMKSWTMGQASSGTKPFRI